MCGTAEIIPARFVKIALFGFGQINFYKGLPQTVVDRYTFRYLRSFLYGDIIVDQRRDLFFIALNKRIRELDAKTIPIFMCICEQP